MVASWACEVTESLTQGSTEEVSFCVRITVTSQAQLATVCQIYTPLFLLDMTLFKNYFFTHQRSYCLIFHLNCEIKIECTSL